MDPNKEIDEWFAEMENPAPSAPLPPPFVECGWCRGGELYSKIESGSTDEVTEYMIWARSATPHTTHSARLVHQLIHKENGFTIEMHDCVERIGGWTLKVVGPLPETKEKREELNDFMEYAWSVAETRGRKVGKWDAETLTSAINEAAPTIPASRWSLDAVAEKITQNLQLKKPLTGDYLRKLIDRRKLDGLWEQWEKSKTGQNK